MHVDINKLIDIYYKIFKIYTNDISEEKNKYKDQLNKTKNKEHIKILEYKLNKCKAKKETFKHKIIHICNDILSLLNIKNIGTLKRIIGYGGYGIVFETTTHLAVKFTYDEYVTLKLTSKYTQYMSDYNITTKVYNIYNIEHTNSKYKTGLQILVMKLYDYTCDDVLLDSKIDLKSKIQMVKNIVNIIDRKTDLKLYCSDVKPGNFVVNKNLETRIIDLDSNFCFMDSRVKESVMKLFIIYELMLSTLSLFKRNNKRKDASLPYIIQTFKSYTIYQNKNRYIDDLKKFIIDYWDSEAVKNFLDYCDINYKTAKLTNKTIDTIFETLRLVDIVFSN